jgi:aspartyl-tRNA(Asn)/glutamyl-tRNA(Gln) amidotransferase subunit A
MKSAELCFLTIKQLSHLIQKKEVSPVELTNSFLERINRLDGKINAYITLLESKSIKTSQKAEKAILSGDYLGPLHGIPISIKDAIITKGIRTTVGSKILSDFIPEEDSTAVKRLKQAGAIIIGKTNLDEFAYSLTTENPYYGTTRNPWDIERIAGGSSGGSAAAIAASLCAGSIGSDTGCSIRQPASLCGVVGFKPTYGRVSRFGVIPVAWSLDHVGPIVKCVEDAAIELNAIAGRDVKDDSSSHMPVPDYTRTLKKEIKRLKIGIPKEYFFENIDLEVRDRVMKAIKNLQDLGASTTEVSFPYVNYAPAMTWIIVRAEAYSYHEPLFKKRGEEYGPFSRENLEVGPFISANHYLKAQRVRKLLQEQLFTVLKEVNAIVIPTTPTPAPRIGQQVLRIGQEEAKIGVLNRLANPFNLSGLPAISIPCGFTADGLPVGLQIAGRPFDEETVLRVAWNYEANTEWHKMRPQL